jgi:hypothetical protein
MRRAEQGRSGHPFEKTGPNALSVTMKGTSRMDDPVESIRAAGDALGVVWSFFEDENTGDLTIAANLLLAAVALLTAYRCFESMKPALDKNLSRVVGVGAGITAVFAAVSLFFLVQAASSVFG